jgi:CDGSH-type Zn-finger protein/uncharacterized Fe-S cluster protein YjdI
MTDDDSTTKPSTDDGFGGDAGNAPVIEEARGRNIVLHFEGRRCIHSRNCVLGAPSVFKADVKGAWIDADGAPVEELAAIARSCPSGAITYERTDGGPAEEPPPVNVVRIRENGPLAVHAEIDIEGHESMVRATLCRCGASRNKPFCDGAHVAAQFAASGEPPSQPTDPLGSRGGALAITPIPDGPLNVRGSVEICTGTGRTIARTRRAAMCRCGGSANKPFCDGAHARIGFRAK